MEGQQTLLDLTLGEVILILRKRKHLTVEELSEVSGVPMSTLSRYERGERDIPSKTLKAIAGALGETPSSLMALARGLLGDSLQPAEAKGRSALAPRPHSISA